MAFREIFCACLILTLLWPALASTKVAAQGGEPTATKWAIQAEYEQQPAKIEGIQGGLVYLLKAVGEVDVTQDPNSPDVFWISGNGTGTWKWTDLPTEDCEGYNGEGNFEATFSGGMTRDPQSGETRVNIGWTAGNQSDPNYAETFEKYKKEYSVTCRQNVPYEPPTFEDHRTSIPLGGALDATLAQLTTEKGAEIRYDYGFEAFQRTSAKLVPTGVKFRVYGTVQDAGGNPMSESRVVIADFDKLQEDVIPFLKKLSDLKPAFENKKTTSEGKKAEYEFTFSRAVSEEILPRTLVVSLLWYDGEAEFAVTNGQEKDGRFVPVYQPLCVDNDLTTKCAKWKETSDGFEAQVDFVYGSAEKADAAESMMEKEPWETGSTDIRGLMHDAGLIYYNSYRAMKYFEASKL